MGSPIYPFFPRVSFLKWLIELTITTNIFLAGRRFTSVNVTLLAVGGTLLGVAIVLCFILIIVMAVTRRGMWASEL